LALPVWKTTLETSWEKAQVLDKAIREKRQQVADDGRFGLSTALDEPSMSSARCRTTA
jgi:hypothetical protein